MSKPTHEMSIREVDELEAMVQADEDAAVYEAEDAIFTLIEKRYPSRRPVVVEVQA